jgi:translation initiation factor 2 subunit 3
MSTRKEHSCPVTYSKWTAVHSEELKRGITIKLGYADATIFKCEKCGMLCTSKSCPKCMEKCEPLRTVSFVDAPGHETLMATVLSGASLMDGILFVIAANEKCPQPQTKEHLMVLNIVGIKKIIIVQTKIDLVTKEQAEENYRQIKELVKGTVAESAPIIPVSSEKGINMDSLIEAMQEFIQTPERDMSKPPKMLVVRSFDVNKPGAEIEELNGGILGGALVQGELKVGDEIEIGPGVKSKESWVPLKTKVTGLQKAGKNLDVAGAGFQQTSWTTHNNGRLA